MIKNITSALIILAIFFALLTISIFSPDSRAVFITKYKRIINGDSIVYECSRVNFPNNWFLSGKTKNNDNKYYNLLSYNQDLGSYVVVSVFTALNSEYLKDVSKFSISESISQDDKIFQVYEFIAIDSNMNRFSIPFRKEIIVSSNDIEILQSFIFNLTVSKEDC